MNIVYLHSHDTGRYVEPYGAPVKTPFLKEFSKQAVVFRNMWATAPVCSGSRSSLLTGEYPHVNGMMGLAHRGWQLHNYNNILPRVLGRNGYQTAVFGEQHISSSLDELGYDYVSSVESKNPLQMNQDVEKFLEGVKQPFFLSIGYWQTHRTSFEDADDDWQFGKTLDHLPDTPETRHDWGRYQKSVKTLDENMGAVIAMLDRFPDTAIVITTDHGPGFPGVKATLHDRGLGVMCMIKAPGIAGFVSEEQVSNIDVFATICDLAKAPIPETQAKVLPLQESEKGRNLVFSELTFHAAFEPMRSVRDSRFRLIRKYSPIKVWPNIDDSMVKDLLKAEEHLPQPDSTLSIQEELFDCLLDPQETRNLADDPDHKAKLTELQTALSNWQTETKDPLLFGFKIPSGAIGNTQQQYSAEEPTSLVKDNLNWKN